MSTLTPYADGGPAVGFVEFAQLEPADDNIREHVDAAKLRELAASIATVGLEVPLTVRQAETPGLYRIKAGWRRYAAIQLIVDGDVDTPEGSPFDAACIPVFVKEGGPDTVTHLVENLQREGLTPIEEAKGYHRLVDEERYSHADVAAAVGKSKTVVTRRLKLLSLPEEVQAAVASGIVSLELADVMTKVPTEVLMAGLDDDWATPEENSWDPWDAQRLESDVHRIVNDWQAAETKRKARAKADKAGYVFAELEDHVITTEPPPGCYWVPKVVTVTPAEGESYEKSMFRNLDELTQAVLPGGDEIIMAYRFGDYGVFGPEPIPEGHVIDPRDPTDLIKVREDGSVPTPEEIEAAAAAASERRTSSYEDQAKERQAAGRARRAHMVDQSAAVLAKAVPAAPALEAFMAFLVTRTDQSERAEAGRCLGLEPVDTETTVWKDGRNVKVTKPTFSEAFNQAWEAAHADTTAKGVNARRKLATACLLGKASLGYTRDEEITALIEAMGMEPFDEAAYLKEWRKTQKAKAAKAAAKAAAAAETADGD